MNRKYRSLRLAGAATVLAVALAACSGGAAPEVDATAEGPTFTFRYSSTYGEQTFEETEYSWMMDQIEEQSGGRITFERFYSGSLVTTPDVPAAIADGRVDVTNLLPVAYGAVMPLWSSSWVPVNGSNQRAHALAQYELLTSDPLLVDELARNNIQVVGTQTVPILGIGTKEPLAEASQFAGLQTRAVGLGAAVISALGGNPVSVTVEEALDALQRNTISGFNGAGLTYWVLSGLAEAGPYWSDFMPGAFGLRAFVFSKTAWDSLPADLQEIVTSVSTEQFMEVEDGFIEEAMTAACDTIIDLGGGVVAFSDAERKKVADALGDSQFETWLEQAVANGLAEADAREFWDRAIALETEIAEDWADWDDGTLACAERSNL